MNRIQHTRERAYSGCIVTLINTQTNELRVRHAPGYNHQIRTPGHRTLHALGVEEALARLLRETDQWEGDWRVRTISTPQTIYQDMQGRESGGKRGTDRPSPEAIFLTKIGRADKLEHPTRQAA